MLKSQLGDVSLVPASAAVVAPYFVPRSAFGANDRILTGHIGLGGQGMSNLEHFLPNAITLCDVHYSHLATAKKRVEGQGRKVEIYSDYRKLLENKDLDAVVISTPDHWHALTTIHGCQAGKDVYCEKPLSLTIAEGRAMVNAARASTRRFKFWRSILTMRDSVRPRPMG